MPTRTGKLLTPALVAIASGAALVASATPAAAYSPNPKAYIADYQARNCPCRNSDPVDGTYFKRDTGKATASKIELWKGGHMVGKMEWHPYGEVLYGYDTANDGDRLYFKFEEYGAGGSATDVTPLPTSKEIDKRRVDLTLPEDELWQIRVYDANGRDLMASRSVFT